jgi:hypothetical protein
VVALFVVKYISMNSDYDPEAEKKLVELVTEIFEPRRKLLVCQYLQRLISKIPHEALDTSRIASAIEVSERFTHSLAKRDELHQAWSLAQRVTGLTSVINVVYKAVVNSSPENILVAADVIRGSMMTMWHPPYHTRVAFVENLEELYEQIKLAEHMLHHGPRIAGLHAGTMWMSDDFDDPLPDEFWLGEDDSEA